MQLIAQLRDEHDLIDAVAGAFRTFASPGSAAPSTADGLAFLRFFRLYAGSYHHAREEEVLFTALVDRLELPRERGPIAVLIDDHRRMSSQLATIERLLAGDLTTGDSRAALSRAVDAYVTSLAHHIDAENSVLLPESEGRLLKRNIQELPSRQPSPDESAARDLGHPPLEVEALVGERLLPQRRVGHHQACASWSFSSASRRARFSWTSFSQFSFAWVVSTSNSKRWVISGVTSATST